MSVEKGTFWGKMATIQKVNARWRKEDPRVLVDHKLSKEHKLAAECDF